MATLMERMDLHEARRHQAALKEIFMSHAGGWADVETLKHVRALCRSANAAICDEFCRRQIWTVVVCAAAFLSESEHQSWQSGRTSGIAHLRSLILRALIAFRSRLYNLETRQRIDALHSSPPLQPPAARWPKRPGGAAA